MRSWDLATACLRSTTRQSKHTCYRNRIAEAKPAASSVTRRSAKMPKFHSSKKAVLRVFPSTLVRSYPLRIPGVWRPGGTTIDRSWPHDSRSRDYRLAKIP
jgi:hypothetical protein